MATTLADVPFDLVVTVCGGRADANCPAFPGRGNVVHVGFDDPPKLANSAATEQESLNHYRRVRDEIHQFAATKLGDLISMPGSMQ